MSELPMFDTPNDAPDADVAPLIDGLKALDPVAVKAALDRKFEATHAVDPSAGIVISDLPDAEPIELNGQVFRLHGARIMPANESTTNYVNPHLHEHGQEPYFILDGTHGEMNTGTIVNERVEWDPPRQVSPGEVITVQENQVHSLRNTGDTTFDFAFASPDSHLQDHTPENPEGDRIFTTGLVGALPPHYPPH
jgi:mannose-6-phosphate isomerase-like protein (cupin superfamily)